jgi:hypothetical protein
VKASRLALGASLALAVLLACVPAAPVAADSFQPITLSVSATATARRQAPLPVTVQISADPGALDVAGAPLRIRVKLAGECGGTFDGTTGPVLLDKQLNPRPVYGHAYATTMTGSGKPNAYGVQTVCAFLEEQGDSRMFANDSSTQVNVSQPCTVSAARYDHARKALRKAERRLRRTHTRAARRLVVKRKHAVRRDRRRASAACGAGVRI